MTGWRFEVWNEPNLSFWAADQAAYFKLYAATARALKSVDPRLQVGGPATAELMWIDQFVRFCAETSTPVDFVSSHIYADDPQENLFGQAMHIAREQVIPRGLAVARSKIRASKFPKLPLVITEWSSQNPAFIAETVSACEGLCDTLSYWTFDNVFEELGPVASYDNTLYGLLNQGGAARPSFHAFQLLHRLGTERLDTQATPVIATRRADGSLAILAWNLTSNVQVWGSAGNPANAPAAEAMPGGPAAQLSFFIRNRTAGTAQITLVDPAADAASKLFEQLGRPSSPTAAQLSQLQKSSGLPKAQRISVDNDYIRTTVPANALMLIELA